jgi:hypothetical protein
MTGRQQEDEKNVRSGRCLVARPEGALNLGGSYRF